MEGITGNRHLYSLRAIWANNCRDVRPVPGDFVTYHESGAWSGHAIRVHPRVLTQAVLGVQPPHRSSASRPTEAGIAGNCGTSEPCSTQPRWLGANRGANRPSLISRVTAKRLKTVAGRKRRVLSGNPSLAVSTSPSIAEITPSPFWSTRATSAAYALNRRSERFFVRGSKDTGRAYTSSKISFASPLGMNRWRNSR